VHRFVTCHNAQRKSADSHWYGPYSAHSQTDPAGPAHGEFKVTRGGSHGTEPYCLRSANRGGAPPETRNRIIDFRVVRGRRLPS